MENKTRLILSVAIVELSSIEFNLLIRDKNQLLLPR